MAAVEVTGEAVRQWGTFGAIMVVFAGCVTVWIKGIPERLRVRNEGRQIELTDAQLLRQEFDELNKTNRKDIHDLKERAAKAEAAHHKAEKDHAESRREFEKALMEAASVQRENRADMDHMMFIIQLLVDEVKRLDPDPSHNRSIQQAEAVLLHMTNKRDPISGERKASAVSSAEGTVKAAQATVDELKHGDSN